MNNILKKFYRANASVLALYTVICAVIIGAFFLTGIFAKEKTFSAGILASAFIILSDLIMFAQVFALAPIKLRRQLDALSAEERAAVIEEFDSAQQINGRYFLNEFAVIFSYRRIYLLRYTDIFTAERGQRNLFLTLKSGKSVIIEFSYTEDIGQTLAALMLKAPCMHLITAKTKKNADK